MSEFASLGDRVRDSVTSVEGVVIGHHKWLTGCDSVTIQPPAKDQEKVPETIAVDITRAVVIARNTVQLIQREPSVTNPYRDAGGPQPRVKQPNT